MSNKTGKGDIQRPCDKEKFDENFERIFRKTPPEIGTNIDPKIPASENKCVSVVKFENEIHDLETILDLQEIRRALLDVRIRSLF